MTPFDLDTLVPPDLRDAVRAADPVRDVPPDLDARARQDLARIVATPPVAARSRRLLKFGLAVAAATTAALAVQAGVVDLWPAGLNLPSGRAYAATPPRLAATPMDGDAGTVLHDIAARTATLPDDVGSGRYAFVETRGWHLWSRIQNDQPVHSDVVEQRVRSWTADDGSGRTWKRVRVPLHLPDVDDSLREPGPLMWPLRSLPADDAGLERTLAIGHPVENGPAERLVAVRDAYGQMPLPPAVRAAVLRFVAATPGIRLAGRVTDRAGRPGIAVSLDSDYSGLPTRYTLIFDERDGRLLGDEEMLTTTAGKLNVPVPSVIGYTTYVDAHYTDSTRD